jgi:hypothetical protein
LAPFQLSSDEVAPRPEVAIAAHLKAVEIVTGFTIGIDTENQAHVGTSDQGQLSA